MVFATDFRPVSFQGFGSRKSLSQNRCQTSGMGQLSPYQCVNYHQNWWLRLISAMAAKAVVGYSRNIGQSEHWTDGEKVPEAVILQSESLALVSSNVSSQISE